MDSWKSSEKSGKLTSFRGFSQVLHVQHQSHLKTASYIANLSLNCAIYMNKVISQPAGRKKSAENDIGALKSTSILRLAHGAILSMKMELWRRRRCLRHSTRVKL